MRPKGKVHDYFLLIKEDGKDVYKCQYCDQKYSHKNATKFAHHLASNCKKCPALVKLSFSKEKENIPSNEQQNLAMEQPTTSGIANAEDDTIDQKKVEEVFARAMFVTGMPLSLFEHELWKEAFQLLKFHIPTRKKLSTSCLEAEHAVTKQTINKKISDAEVLHLAVDGWSNIRNESILNIIVYTPEPIFYDFVETQTNRHNSEYLASELTKVIENIGQDRFFAMVTDNAANMAKCGRLICNKFKKMIWIGCIAHTLNLMVGDILRKTCVKEIFEVVLVVVKSITQSHILAAEFRKTRSEKNITVSLALPVKTRWGSYLHCLENFSKCKRILQTMAVNEDLSELQRHKINILNESTWTQIEKHKKILKPIVEWTTRLEADYSTIHLVYQALKEIGEVLENDEDCDIFSEEDLEDLRLKFDQRKRQALHPIHFAASILNPRVQGSILTSDDHVKGCQMIIDTTQFFFGFNYVQDVLLELSEFKARKVNFDNESIWEQGITLSAYSWWQLFFPNSLLGKVAQKILSVPSTSASVERSFSTFSNIHTKKRNKLNTNRAGKICFVAHNWKLLNSKKKTLTSSTSTATLDEDNSSDEDNSLDEEETDETYEVEPTLFMSVAETFVEAESEPAVDLSDPLA